MKKIILLAFAAACLTGSSQSSIQVTLITNTTSPVIVAANADMGTVTHKYLETEINFDIKNTSASGTNTYVIKRYDVTLNRTSLPDTASAFFCLATCFLADIHVSPPVILDHGQSTSQIPGGANYLLDTHLLEASETGFSHIKYTIMNIVTPSDSLQFSIKYNLTSTGIKETNKTLSSFEIFPNPAKGITSILIQSPKTFDSNLMLFNSLGEVVYKKEISVTEGKNQTDINIENLPSGLYFASIKAAGMTISKKLIIN